jgi:aryl carrier-like protein
LTEMEGRIAAVWQQLLGLEQVGIHDNFFDLGGHSLLIVRLQQQLQTILRRPITLVELFQFPTVHALATHLSTREEDHLTGNGLSVRVEKQKRALFQQKQRAHTKRCSSQ